MSQRLSPAVVRAVLCDIGAGLSHTEIASKYTCSPRTISRYSLELKRDTPQSEIATSVQDRRERLINKGVLAVEAGLDDTEDSYKRANIGVQTLKGTGFFAPDNQTNINAIISGMPNEWMTDDPPPKG